MLTAWKKCSKLSPLFDIQNRSLDSQQEGMLGIGQRVRRVHRWHYWVVEGVVESSFQHCVLVQGRKLKTEEEKKKQSIIDREF